MQKRALVLFLAALAASPATAAAWGVKGDSEPSTRKDIADGYMFLTPPQSQTDAGRVYFNGWFSNGYVTNPNHNPNVGQLGTGVAPVPFKAWALLGVWRDCNKDGYIGLSDPGLIEYPAVVPGVDAALCPATPLPTPIPAYGWVPTHNDGQWVREFLPLGWEEWRTMWNTSDSLNSKVTVKEQDDNPFDLNDTDARVWVDLHLPDARFGGGSNCYIVPQPRGTIQSTGGVVESADCFAGFRGTDALTTAGNAGADGTPLGQLSFKDKPRDQSNSTSRLNQPNPWGKESDPEYVDTWDCTKPQAYNLLVTHPVTGATVYYVNVSQPKVPSGVTANGKPAGQVNATEGGFDECKRSQTGNNDADIYSQVEGDVVNSARKVKPDDALYYNEVNRREYAHVLVTDTKVERPSPSMPDDLGTRPGSIGVTTGADGVWQGLTTILVAPINRNTMEANPVRHTTFYASVGAAAASRYGLKFPGVTGTYGAENCALPLAQQLFECNAALWWPGDTEPRTQQLGAQPGRLTECADGTSTSTGGIGCVTYGARVGMKYQLRDVDCYDYATKDMRGNGVHWGLLSNTQCQ